MLPINITELLEQNRMESKRIEYKKVGILCKIKNEK